MGVVRPAGVARGDVFLVDLQPARGTEIRKPRPCVIVSPDDLNASLSTFVVAPMTTGSHPYAYRIPCRFEGKSGHVVADQIRAVDGGRLVRRLGHLTPATIRTVLTTLQQMFAP